MTRRASFLLAAVAACGALRTALAQDTGALDVEVRNRAVVSGAIGAPQELDTLRLRVPEGASLQVSVKGSGRVRPLVRVLGTDDIELDLGASLVRKGKTAKVTGFTPGPAGLYRIDVRAEGTATGNYKLTASWSYPAKELFEGATDDLGAFYTFDAEAGTRVDVKLATRDAGASVRSVRVLGPRGFEHVFATPAKPSAKNHVRTPPLPATGRYQLDLVTDVGGRNVSGTLARKAPSATAPSNLRRAERRGKGVARTVGRLFDEDGGGVDVPRLEQQQRVSLDATGVCLAVPAGALPFPSAFGLQTDDDAIDDPLGFAPAGVSVHFDAGGATFEMPVQITLPYDVGAFVAGDVLADLCVLRQGEDGGVSEQCIGAVVDEANGLVTFPTSTFSSYQVFQPPIEVVPVADVGTPNDLAVAPDGSALYLSTDVLMAGNPAAAVMRFVPGNELELFAGGGAETGDFVPRLDYDFDNDLGFSGVLLAALATDEFGNVLVVTGDIARTTSVVYLVTTAGLVLRIAGDGTPLLDESLPARDTGLPFCCAAAFRDDGNAYVVTDAFPYPESDRVLAIVAESDTLDSLTVTTVAGGGVVDVSGSPPLATRLLQPRAVTVDSQGRVLVGDRDWLVRFDLFADTTTTLAGTNFGETDGGGVGRTIGGVGAPLRTVVLGALDDLAFAPGREDILYAADPEAGIVWRFDLDRDRAFVAAGRRVDFDRTLRTRAPDPDAAEPGEVLSFPSAVAPLGAEVYIAERFDNRLFALRRR